MLRVSTAETDASLLKHICLIKKSVFSNCSISRHPGTRRCASGMHGSRIWGKRSSFRSRLVLLILMCLPVHPSSSVKWQRLTQRQLVQRVPIMTRNLQWTHQTILPLKHLQILGFGSSFSTKNSCDPFNPWQSNMTTVVPLYDHYHYLY